MNEILSFLVKPFSRLNSWRDKWLQSQLRAYFKDFRQRSLQNKEYWFEKIAQWLFQPLIEKEIVNAPNLISIFRGLMAFPLLIFILDQRYMIALIFFIVIMLLDAIDGPLAKVLDQQTDLGEILDPTGDKLVFAAVFLTLGMKYLTPWIFYATLVIELIIVFLALILRPIAKKLGLDFKKKALITGKIKLNVEVFACGFLILHHLVDTSLIGIANWLFIAALPLSLASIAQYLLTVKKRSV